MQMQKAIEQLGYSPKEAKVYLVALSLGAAHVSDIAAKVKLPRSSVQVIIDKLHTDGLMNFYIMRRYKFWVAENPERLLSFIKKREAAINEALPSLLELRKLSRRRKHDVHSDAISLGHLRLVADEVVQPVLITNDTIEIVYVNGAWEKKFDYTLSEVYGKNPALIKSNVTPRATHNELWRLLKQKRLFHSNDIIDAKKDGTLVKVCTTIFPVEHSGSIFYVQIVDT